MINSQNEKRIKVAWICHFTNDHIQEILNPRRKINEFAPWISNIIKVLENKNAMDLHIISPHRWISKYKTFKENGITYHFFNPGIPFYGRHWPSFFKFDRWTNYYSNKKKVTHIVNKIKPNIIHLMGAENAYYSSTVLRFIDKYPALITIQGFISHSSTNSKNILYNKVIEKKILESFSNFGYRTIKMGESIKSFKKRAILHWHQFPIFIIDPLNIPFNKRKYDCVFFARICKDKGVEDLLKATEIIKRKKKDISVLIIGGIEKSYLAYLKAKCKELNISGNITWAGFLSTQKDVHVAASNARISVLPTYYEIIAGTIIESMFLKIPVVAYDVGSINELNKEKEHVILLKKFDVDGLAESIYSLLQDENLLNAIAEDGYTMIKKRYDNYKIYPELMDVYHTIIKDFQNNQTIHN
jgi:glycosyltransferase involved in cell wall biosynthesis